MRELLLRRWFIFPVHNSIQVFRASHLTCAQMARMQGGDLTNPKGLPRVGAEPGKLRLAHRPESRLTVHIGRLTVGSSGSEIRISPVFPDLGCRISNFPWWVSRILRLTVRPRPNPTFRVV